MKVYGISGGGDTQLQRTTATATATTTTAAATATTAATTTTGSAEEVQRKCRPLTRDAIDFRPSPESALKLQLTLQA